MKKKYSKNNVKKKSRTLCDVHVKNHHVKIKMVKNIACES